MLQVRFHTARDVGKAFTADTASGGAKAGKVVLMRFDIAGVFQESSLDQHLEDGIIPAKVHHLAVAHVFRCDGFELFCEPRIVLVDVRQQPSWSNARRNGVALTCLNGRQSRLGHGFVARNGKGNTRYGCQQECGKA